MNENGIDGGVFGKCHTEETKLKMSLNSLGNSHTNQVKAKMSKDRVGINNNFYNKKHSDATRAVLSDKAKSRFNRPWKTLKADLKIYERLDEIYNIWLNNNKPKQRTLAKLCGINTQIQGVTNYFLKYGNPSEDQEYIDWLISSETP